MLVKRSSVGRGGALMPGTAALRNEQLRDAIGPHWRYEQPGVPERYASNGATHADGFVFLHGGFGASVEGMHRLARVLETDTDGRVCTHVVVRKLDSLSVDEAAKVAAKIISEESRGRPVMSLGLSAGGAINRVVGATNPELIELLVDLNSVGNSPLVAGGPWKGISEALIALGDGEGIEQRLDSGFDRLRADSRSAVSSRLYMILGPAMREWNGVVRGVEFTVSGVTGGRVYDSLTTGIVRLVRYYGEDWVRARCLQRLCSDIDVRPHMARIGALHEAGATAPHTLPARGRRDPVCKASMLREAAALMHSRAALELTGLSHEVGVAQPAVHELVGVCREATLALARGGDPDTVFRGIVEHGSHRRLPMRALQSPWEPNGNGTVIDLTARLPSLGMPV